MTLDTAQPKKTKSFWRTLGDVLKVLLQLVLIVVFMAAIGVGLYIAIPWLYRTAILPVQTNTSDIAALSGRMDQVEALVDQRTTALQTRNAALEGEMAGLQETVAVQDRLLATAAAELATLVPGVDSLYETTKTQTEDLAKLEQSLARAIRGLDDQSKLLAGQADELAGAKTELASQADLLASQVHALAAQEADIMGRMALLQAAQDLVRVQLLLLEDNTGAAQESLALTVEHLTRAAALSPELAMDAAGWVQRITILSTLIQERSFRAAPALEALWADIADRVLPALPEGAAPLPLLQPTVEGATSTLTETVTGTLTLTPTLAITPTITATVVVTPTLTPTPKP